MAARRRGGPRDLLLSMVVLAVVLVGVVAFSQASSRPRTPVAPVDYLTPLRGLRTDAPFPVYAPSPQPAGWIANHAIAHSPDAADRTWSWDVGFYVPDGNQYAAVEQSSAAAFTAAQLGATGRQTGTTDVGGTSWQTWTDAAGRPALVRAVTGSTLVLDGKASLATLERLAASLTTT